MTFISLYLKKLHKPLYTSTTFKPKLQFNVLELLITVRVETFITKYKQTFGTKLFLLEVIKKRIQRSFIKKLYLNYTAF